MEDNERAIMPVEEGWRARTMLMGGLIGAVLGLLSAYLYLRTAEESHEEGRTPEAPETRDAVKLGVALLTIIRTIAEWGKR
jgi:gas vesicle protein